MSNLLDQDVLEQMTAAESCYAVNQRRHSKANTYICSDDGGYAIKLWAISAGSAAESYAEHWCSDHGQYPESITVYARLANASDLETLVVAVESVLHFSASKQ